MRSSWSITHIPSGTACIPLGWGPGVYHRTRAVTRSALATISFPPFSGLGSHVLHGKGNVFWGFAPDPTEGAI